MTKVSKCSGSGISKKRCQKKVSNLCINNKNTIDSSRGAMPEEYCIRKTTCSHLFNSELIV